MKCLLTILSLVCTLLMYAQEQELENQTEANETTTQDDSYWQLLEYYRRHPLNINEASERALQELQLLTGWQIHQLIRYRRLVGKLVHLYELQAVPGWDTATIRQLLPFIEVADRIRMTEKLSRRFKGGEQSFLLRFAQTTGEPADTVATYAGSAASLLFRYRYNFKNLLQFGITGDKDAGEQLFKGAQKNGFDFYSAHVFARKLGIVEALALGDFTVNLGQGLIHWQSLAFKKSATVLNIKRQSPVLRPYNSTGEFNFHRGMGITLQRKNRELTLFGSLRRLSAHLTADSGQPGQVHITSFLPSGYHRTATELRQRNNITCQTFGGNLQFRYTNWHIGINALYYRFSQPLRPTENLYDLFSITGDRWSNYSVDYSATIRNVHVFGELAVDKQLHIAFMQGALVSLDQRVALSLMHRQLSKNYQSLFSNAFTENNNAVNEQGLYAGLSWRPSANWQMDAYADLFRFPWLKYRVAAPGSGSEYLLQLVHRPNKQVEITSRFRAERKPANLAEKDAPVHRVVPALRQNWRTQVTVQVHPRLTLRKRVELLWYDRLQGAGKENGFAAFAEIAWQCKRALAADLRLHYYNTEGYDTRMYAYERDVLYSFSIPALFNTGYRYYVQLRYDAPKKWLGGVGTHYKGVIWVRWAGFLPAPGAAGVKTAEPAGQAMDWRVQLMLIQR